MKKRMIYVMIAVVMLAGCVSGPKVDNTPVSELDLNRYLGEWYEIARFDHSFERGVEQAKANYTLNEDGTIKVVNSGIKDGKPKTAKGKAKRTVIPSLFRVSSLVLSTLTIASCCWMQTTSICSLAAAQITTYGFSPTRPSSPKRPKRKFSPRINVEDTIQISSFG